MSDINFSKLTWENLPARTTALSATNLNRIENGINDSVNGVNANSHSIAELQTRISQLANGSPTPVATVAEMTDESAVYLYTGSETGYTAGNWYYYNGTAWTSGGVYGGAVTDTTLSISGNYVPFKLYSPTMIAQNTDLNTLTTAGSYYCNGNNIAATLVNCPVNVTFRMNVYTIWSRDSGSYAYIFQEIIPYNSTAIYRRRCSTGGTADVWTFGKWETDLGVMSDTFGTNGWQDVENTCFTRDYGDDSSIGDCRVYKQGGLAIVKLDGRIIANPSGWQTIGNVEKSVAIIETNVLTNNGQVVRLRVTTSGALQMAYTGEVPAIIGTSFFYPMQVT